MIRLVRPPAPSSLVAYGPSALRRLARQVAAGKSPKATGLYRARRVKKALIEMQRGKCAFCESYVSHRFEGDVDHFRPKAGWRQSPRDPLVPLGYWWLTYEWTNLFYTCELCNRRFKENLFPITGARAASSLDDLAAELALLIDPTTEEPSLYLRFRDEIPYAVGGNARGDATIRVFGLDESDQPKGLVEMRAEELGDFRGDLRLFDVLRAEWSRLPLSVRERTRELQERLLQRAQPDRSYSAMFRDAIASYDAQAATPLGSPLP